MLKQQQQPQIRMTMTTIMSKRRALEAVKTASSSSFVGAAVCLNVGGSVRWSIGKAVGEGNGFALGTSVGIAVGVGIGSAVGSPGATVGDGIGMLVGAESGNDVGMLVGAGDGGVDGGGDGAGVGENVATSTDSACALAIDSRRAARSPGAPTPASRRRAAAVWIAVVKLPSLTAASSVVITCECTVCSPGLPAYKLAMTASATRTSLVSVTPVLSSVHAASSKVEFERTASHASS